MGVPVMVTPSPRRRVTRRYAQVLKRRRAASVIQSAWRRNRARKRARMAANNANEIKFTTQTFDYGQTYPGILHSKLLMQNTSTGATGFSDVIGNKAFVRGTRIYMRISHANQGAVNFVRVMLVRKMISTGSPHTELFRGINASAGRNFDLGQTPNPGCFPARINMPINKRKYQVLYDKRMRMVKGPATTNSFNMDYRIWNSPYIRINKKYVFDGMNRSDNQIYPNIFWLWFVENSAGDPNANPVNIQGEIYTFFSG